MNNKKSSVSKWELRFVILVAELRDMVHAGENITPQNLEWVINQAKKAK